MPEPDTDADAPSCTCPPERHAPSCWQTQAAADARGRAQQPPAAVLVAIRDGHPVYAEPER